MLILDLAERTQNWFGKPFSGKMTSWNDDSNHKPEQVLAVAAAAATYVINSIAEPSIQDQKKTSAGLGPSLTRDKSRKEDTSFSTSKPGTVSKQFSGRDPKHEKLNSDIHVVRVL